MAIPGIAASQNEIGGNALTQLLNSNLKKAAQKPSTVGGFGGNLNQVGGGGVLDGIANMFGLGGGGAGGGMGGDGGGGPLFVGTDRTRSSSAVPETYWPSLERWAEKNPNAATTMNRDTNANSYTNMFSIDPNRYSADAVGDAWNQPWISDQWGRNQQQLSGIRQNDLMRELAQMQQDTDMARIDAITGLFGNFFGGGSGSSGGSGGGTRIEDDATDMYLDSDGSFNLQKLNVPEKQSIDLGTTSIPGATPAENQQAAAASRLYGDPAETATNLQLTENYAAIKQALERMQALSISLPGTQAVHNMQAQETTTDTQLATMLASLLG